MQPRFKIQASWASSRTTISWAVRPEGKLSSTVSIHSGRDSGARFWKKNSPSAPLTKRFKAMGRPPTPRSAPSGSARRRPAYAGVPMAEDGADLLAAGKGFVDLSSRRKIAVSGGEALSWLNNLVSANLSGLGPGRAARSLLLTSTGRVAAEFTVAI